MEADQRVVVSYRLNGQWHEEVIKPDLSGTVLVNPVITRLVQSGAFAVSWENA